MSKARMLPQSEIDDICKQSYDRIWKYHNNQNQDWEKRISRTFEILTKKNKIFSEFVDKLDYYYCLDDMYHEDYTRKQFERIIKKKLCTFKKYEFYYVIPGTFNFPTNLQLGTCTCFQFKHLRKEIQNEILYWWLESHPYNREYKEDKEYRKGILIQNLFLRIDIEVVGFAHGVESVEQTLDSTLNILRFVMEGDIQPSLGVVYVVNEKFVSAPQGNWEKTRDLQNFSWYGRYDSLTEREINQLSKIYQEKKLSDLEQRVKQATTLFGFSLAQTKLSIRLILLCSGMEILVVTERERIKDKLAERIPHLVKNQNKSEVKGDIKKLYTKRSGVVHSKLSDTITKKDVEKCQKYLFESIECVLHLIDKGYSILEDEKGKKSLAKHFDWKLNNYKKDGQSRIF